MTQEPQLTKPVQDLLYQAYETELGGVEIYRIALLCVKNADLKEEWTEYLTQTEHHVEVIRGVIDALGLDPEATTPGRQIVRDKGKALLSAMQKALKEAPQAAEVVAAECVVDAETKDHSNWKLIGAVAEKATGNVKDVLQAAYDEVEDEEDEHLYHTRGWCRELALEALGLPAQLPPAEEERDVKTALEAAVAADDRKPDSSAGRKAPGQPRQRP